MIRGALALAAFLAAGTAMAVPANQFLLTGPIEHLSLDSPGDPASGGRMIVHGVEVVLPRHVEVQLPGQFLSLADVFAQAPMDSPDSGLALADATPPLAAFEASVAGNIVGSDHIAGLVSISQHSLAQGQGVISAIDPATGIITLVPNAGSTTQTRLRLNDPDGRYGPAAVRADATPSANVESLAAQDARFGVDTANSPILAVSGYPMCVQRAAPDDLLCPSVNRPGGGTTRLFVMGSAPMDVAVASGRIVPPCSACDPTRQAPLAVGDDILYAGTLARDTTGLYISVHSLEANVGIFTAAGTDPAYVAIEDGLIGTQGPDVIVPGVNNGSPLMQETQNRLHIEGFTTDPTRRVELFAVDVDPSGVAGEQLRYYATADRGDPATLGRFRLRLDDQIAYLGGTDGLVRGAPREFLARIEGGQNVTGMPDPDFGLRGNQLDGHAPPAAPLAANGLVAGRYQAPFGEYIFPENKTPGDPLIPFNFECLPFLSFDGAGGLGLSPWPGETAPALPAAGESWVQCGNPPKPLTN